MWIGVFVWGLVRGRGKILVGGLWVVGGIFFAYLIETESGLIFPNPQHLKQTAYPELNPPLV